MGSGVSREWSVKQRISEQSQEQNPLLRVSIAAMGMQYIPVISKFCPLITSLDVSNNMISALPEHLQRFHALTHLDVSTNQLSTLPVLLSALALLTDLRASDNSINHLPDALDLPSLNSLSLCRNYLGKGLPPHFCQSCQSSLKVLRLSDNGLGCGGSHVSHALATLTALVELRLGSNSLGGDTL
jgi:Leucine-rich repeat (LRR) protein